MDETAATMSHFLSEVVAPHLRPAGFIRNGMRFEAERGSNKLYVHFQRRDELFTCDLGVVSGRLLEVDEWAAPDHLRLRLGPVAEGFDRWWDLSDRRENLAAEFLSALDRGLATIEPLTSDEALRDRWLAEAKKRDLTDAECDWLARLIAVLGPARA